MPRGRTAWALHVPRRCSAARAAEPGLRPVWPPAPALVEAFSRIDTNLTLAIVGGSAGSDDYVAEIKKYEGPRVKLLDYVYGEALDELYSNAYLAVLPSTLEGLSLALLESLSHGRCVLVSDIPENMEVAEECALSFKSKDVEDLRSKLQHLIEHPEEVARYGDRARAHIAQHYSWDTVAESTARLYEQLTGKSRTSRPDGEGPGRERR